MIPAATEAYDRILAANIDKVGEQSEPRMDTNKHELHVMSQPEFVFFVVQTPD